MIKEDNLRVSITLDPKTKALLDKIKKVRRYKTYTRAIKFLLDLFKSINLDDIA